MNAYLPRRIHLESTLGRKSCFLLGPRQTGKSTLIRECYSSARIYNLLEGDTYRALSRQPRILRQELSDYDGIVVIDEVQRLPELLNEVHMLIEEKKLRFLLTGSSARKLRRGGVNLLGGRARWKSLHPLVSAELGNTFDLERALTIGTLASIYHSDEPTEDLKDYIELYLREEIAAETAIRQLPTFSRFLDTAALCNGHIVNYQEVGNDAQVAPSTVREYFGILKDTLLIHRLPAWRESVKRKATAKDKYYFFDTGVVRHLQGRTALTRQTDDYGKALETYIHHELRTYCDYISGEDLSYWRSTTGQEVDFLLSKRTAIEVKAAEHIAPKHLKGLKALREENVFERYLLVSNDNRSRIIDGIELMNVSEFLDNLWKDAL